ncbi:MAG TPA: DUF3800 domain-containing protein [Chlamydiales bacterium]|jgi:hypothetical protein|nr:DUF3800 domain-containing protein [Chlamydiales bacterium]
MVLAFGPTDVGYIAYIDESGDPGIKGVEPVVQNGATEWFSLGALVMKKETDADTVGWVQRLNAQIHNQKLDLHYSHLTSKQRRVVCNTIAGLPVRCFAVISNKKNMSGYTNLRAEAARGASANETFYNFCVRVLLERVTEFVLRRSMMDHAKPKHVHIIFSERGGVRYEQTIAYLDILMNQARSGQTFLEAREIEWEVMHPQLIEKELHSKSAGLQLADSIASSFRFAADVAHPRHNLADAKLLKPRMWTKNGYFAYHGVTFLPWNPRAAKLSDAQKAIFKFYGYSM